MDTSAEYIKMCEKAEEIQPYLNSEDGVGGTWVGNYIILNPEGYFHVTDDIATRKCESCGSEEEYIKSSTAIWLPRQDQLQEMCHALTEDVWTPYFALTMLKDFADEHPQHTMEQLWLAFVMKERYNKIWDGNEWTN